MFKPQLAEKVHPDFKHIEWDNLAASPKYDGIRAIVINGKLMSRSMKLIPNLHCQALFAGEEFEGLDGELIVGSPTAEDVYNVTESAVMSKAGTPDVKFYVFDQIAVLDVDYQTRYDYLFGLRLANSVIVPQTKVTSKEALLAYENARLLEGYEGIMLRKLRGPNSYYKMGRATAKQGNLLKLKRFTDTEAEIVGFEEEMFNGNEATVNELGRTARSSHQENKFGKGRLGALTCRWTNGLTFNIGTGFTAQQRADLWAERDKLPGRLAKFKYFEIGTVDRPRFPVFLGFRSEIDV